MSAAPEALGEVGVDGVGVAEGDGEDDVVVLGRLRGVLVALGEAEGDVGALVLAPVGPGTPGEEGVAERVGLALGVRDGVGVGVRVVRGVSTVGLWGVAGSGAGRTKT